MDTIRIQKQTKVTVKWHKFTRYKLYGKECVRRTSPCCFCMRTLCCTLPCSRIGDVYGRQIVDTSYRMSICPNKAYGQALSNFDNLFKGIATIKYLGLLHTFGIFSWFVKKKHHDFYVFSFFIHTFSPAFFSPKRSL